MDIFDLDPDSSLGSYPQPSTPVEIELRAAYLRSELEVWGGRQERALRSDCQPLKDLYLNHDMNKMVGEIRGELFRLNEQIRGFGMPATSPRRAGRRRPKATN